LRRDEEESEHRFHRLVSPGMEQHADSQRENDYGHDATKN
jgi:hypothetical protein